MIAYYVDGSIHQIPSFIHIARVLGGIVFTDDRGSHDILRQYYADVNCEFYPDLQLLRERLTFLQPEAVVQPDYYKKKLALPFQTLHIQVFHGASDKRYGISSRTHGYDFFLIAGERGRARKTAAGILKPGNYAMVGYPKADRIFRGEFDKEIAKREMGLDPSRPTILYAPTWRDAKQNSSLPRFCFEIMSNLPADYNLLVKPHPNTKRFDRKYYTLLTRLAAAKPEQIKLLGFAHDAIPVMAGADLLLSDISTVAQEFLCFQRPMVFLDPRRIPMGKKKIWLWRCGPVVKKRGMVWNTVREALAHPDQYARERHETLAMVFYQPDGHAAERAAEAIRTYIAGRRLSSRNGKTQNTASMPGGR